MSVKEFISNYENDYDKFISDAENRFDFYLTAGKVDYIIDNFVVYELYMSKNSIKFNSKKVDAGVMRLGTTVLLLNTDRKVTKLGNSSSEAYTKQDLGSRFIGHLHDWSIYKSHATRQQTGEILYDNRLYTADPSSGYLLEEFAPASYSSKYNAFIRDGIDIVDNGLAYILEENDKYEAITKNGRKIVAKDLDKLNTLITESYMPLEAYGYMKRGSSVEVGKALIADNSTMFLRGMVIQANPYYATVFTSSGIEMDLLSHLHLRINSCKSMNVFECNYKIYYFDEHDNIAYNLSKKESMEFKSRDHFLVYLGCIVE